MDDGTRWALGQRLDPKELNRLQLSPLPAWYPDTKGDIVTVELFGEETAQVILATDSRLRPQSNFFPNVKFGESLAKVKQARPGAGYGSFGSAPAVVEKGSGYEVYYLSLYCSDEEVKLPRSSLNRKLVHVIIARPGKADFLLQKYGGPCSFGD